MERQKMRRSCNGIFGEVMTVKKLVRALIAVLVLLYAGCCIRESTLEPGADAIRSFSEDAAETAAETICTVREWISRICSRI